MVAPSEPVQKMPLGVGKIISDAFSVLFGNFFKVLAIGFITAFSAFLLQGLLVGFNVAAGLAELELTGTGDLPGLLATVLFGLFLYALATALMVPLAYDAKLGRTNSLGAYFNFVLPALLPIVVLTFAAIILAMIGALALLVGTLWVLAVFYVIAPAAVIERVGFGAWGRSIALTKEYRWPIVGLGIVIMILTTILAIIGGAVSAAAAHSFAQTGILFSVGVGALSSLLEGLSYVFGGIAVALTYARLREIKEGVDIDQIVAAFD